MPRILTDLISLCQVRRRVSAASRLLASPRCILAPPKSGRRPGLYSCDMSRNFCYLPKVVGIHPVPWRGQEGGGECQGKAALTGQRPGGVSAQLEQGASDERRRDAPSETSFPGTGRLVTSLGPGPGGGRPGGAWGTHLPAETAGRWRTATPSSSLSDALIS